MRYMVMECHFSYAVVLDEEGRFLKVANMHYEVGQTLIEVIELIEPPAPTVPLKRKSGHIYSLITAAACLVLAFTIMFQLGQRPHASIYFSVNPEVRIDVDRKNMVVKTEGLNEEGKVLLQGRSYRGKPVEQVMNELVSSTIEEQYLQYGGRVHLLLESEDEQWMVEQASFWRIRLESIIPETMEVTIEVTYAGGGQGNTAPIQTDYGDSLYEEEDRRETIVIYTSPTAQEQIPSSEEIESKQSGAVRQDNPGQAAGGGSSGTEANPGSFAVDDFSHKEAAVSAENDSGYGASPQEENNSPYAEAAAEEGGDSSYEEAAPAEEEEGDSSYEE